MSDKYFNKYESSNYEQNFAKNVKRDKKYSKKVFLWGLAGLAVMALDYYFSDQFCMDSLYKPFKEMNGNELVHTTLLTLSTSSAFGGGIMYGLSKFFETDLKIERANNINKLRELKIEQKEKINTLERNLRD
jgi:hypothetical protein